MDRYDVDEVQLWLASGLRLFPALHHKFLNSLVALSYRNKVCLLPQYRLESFSDKIRKAE